MVQTGLKTIARFSNIAEAGFFAHELMQQAEIPSSISTQEDFDAVTGFWTTSFLLAVPEDRAEVAGVRLQELIEHQDGNVGYELPPGRYEDATNTTPWAFDPEDRHGIESAEAARNVSLPWGSILLTITAGTCVFFGVKTLQNPAAVQRAQAKDTRFWDSMSGDEPWVQRTRSGGVRRVWFDRESRTVRLEEDHDGDGKVDRRETISPAQQ